MNGRWNWMAPWAALVALLAMPAFAQEAAPASDQASSDQTAFTPEDWSLHAQSTFIEQGYMRFHSPYRGPNSLDPAPRGRESWTGTLFLGRRMPWEGGALYFDPEFNQGFGLSKTEGVAGFPNGAGAEGNFDNPKPNVARLFLRQTFGLGGDQQQNVAGDQNQLADKVDANHLTVTAGKFSPTDLFDTNDYANDPRNDFMNGSVWAAGAWDYPADAKGYSDGAAIEWVHPGWTLRGGWFLEPKIANQRDLEPRFWHSFGSVAELENHFKIGDRDGVLRTLVFANRAPMGSNDQAAANGARYGVLPWRSRWKPGFAVRRQAVVATTAVLLRSRLKLQPQRRPHRKLGVRGHRSQHVAGLESQRHALAPRQGYGGPGARAERVDPAARRLFRRRRYGHPGRRRRAVLSARAHP